MANMLLTGSALLNLGAELENENTYLLRLFDPEKGQKGAILKLSFDPSRQYWVCDSNFQDRRVVQYITSVSELLSTIFRIGNLNGDIKAKAKIKAAILDDLIINV